MLIACNRPIAFLKQYSTQCARQTAQDAVQIFGGRGITQSGMGKFIEHVRCLSPLKLQSIISELFSPSITVPSLSTRYLVAPRTYWATSVLGRRYVLCPRMQDCDYVPRSYTSLVSIQRLHKFYSIIMSLVSVDDNCTYTVILSSNLHCIANTSTLHVKSVFWILYWPRKSSA